MESQVEEIKEKSDILAIISPYVKLTRAGRNYKGLCPFHSERTPSFTVSAERGTWRCFGCGEHGDVITFLEKYENLTFMEALEQLAQKAGVTLKKSSIGQDGRQKARQRLYEVLSLSAEFYHYLLTNHQLGEAARKYAQDRDISHEMIAKYQLGFAPNSWQSLTQYLVKKGYTPQEIAATGMSSQGNSRPYDRFRGRLMFPVTDVMGRVIGFSGRSLIEDDKSPKYLNSPENELFHKGKLLYGLSQAKDAIRRANRLILVEGNVDVLSSAQMGVGEIVAPLGTALTPEQVSLIKKFATTIYIAFDQDSAGQKATRRSIELLKQAELEIKVVELIEGSDPDDCIKRDPANWTTSLNRAKEVFDYYLGWANRTFDLNQESGKIKASLEIVPLIAATTNPVAQSFLVQRAADALALDEQAIRQQLRSLGSRFQAPGDNSQPSTSTAQTPKLQAPAPDRHHILIEYIMSQVIALVAQDAPRGKVLQQIDLLHPDTFLNYASLLANTRQALASTGHYALNRLTEGLSPAELEEFDRLNLIPTMSGLTDGGKIGHSIDEQLRDLDQAIQELKKLEIKQQLNHLTRSLRQAEVLDKSQVKTLQNQIIKLSRELAEL